jgi:transcriptional pleiotropic regulator of transition state genes
MPILEAAMVTTGMARKVDELGRIVLPVEMRRMFGIRAGDELDIGVQGDSIFLRKRGAGCVFCAGVEGLRSYRDKLVCATCAAELGGTI